MKITRTLTTAITAVAAALTLGSLPIAPEAAAAPSFFNYTGDLSGVANGTVLKTRVLPRSTNPELNANVVQIVFRSTNALDKPIAAVTSVIIPKNADPRKAVSYQSFYDSLNPEDGPSRYLAGAHDGMAATFGTEIQSVQSLLDDGYTVIASDTQGPRADFAAGPVYGKVTLDSIRAALQAPATKLGDNTRVGLIGYSGGAIGTSWAAALAPSYAPDINARITGAASGGILVNPAHNLRYVEGSLIWAGVFPMAMVGIGRAYNLNIDSYLTPRGLEITRNLQKAHISNVLGQYPGLKWTDIAKPQYSDPNSVKAMTQAFVDVNLGGQPTPTVPLFLGQGTGGEMEGTLGNKPGIGPGDGVMIAGDVRTLARQYCKSNHKLKYTQYEGMSHTVTMTSWFPTAVDWLKARQAGKPAPSSCGNIAPGNPLVPRF